MTSSFGMSTTARARRLFGAVVLAAAAAACGGTGGGASGGGVLGTQIVATAKDCDRVSSVALPGPSYPTTALVVDETSSGPASTVPRSVTAMLQRAQAAHGQLVILGVEGTDANPILVKDVALDPEPTHTSREAGNARAIAIACVSQWITSNAAMPTRPGSDILGAVNAAVRRAPAQIIVMSDGLDNVDPLDLNKIGYGADPSSVATSLQATHSIDHAGSPIPVLWADLGVTGKPIPGVARASLKLMWTAILRAAGTSVTFAPDEAQAGTPRPNAPADMLKLPAVVSAVSGCHKTFTLPTDLLFQPGNAHLPAGATVLGRVRSDLISEPGSSATVSGHTAAYGSTAYRHNLSVARAQAVAQALEAQGISKRRLQVAGYGSTKPAVNEFQNGRHDLAAAAANRRVVIDITPRGCI